MEAYRQVYCFGGWTVRAAAAGIVALILGIAFCPDIASAQQTKAPQTCDDVAKQIIELQHRRSIWEQRVKETSRRLGDVQVEKADADLVFESVSSEADEAAKKFKTTPHPAKQVWEDTAEGKALGTKLADARRGAGNAKYRAARLEDDIKRFQREVDNTDKELNALMSKDCPSPPVSALVPESAAPSTPAPQPPGGATAPAPTLVAKVIPSPPGTAVQHVNQPDCASDYNSGRSLRWDKAKKTWIDADTGAEMGFQGMVAKDGMVIPAPPVVTARSGGKHQAQQDKSDPEKAHDSVTGQDLKWDRDKNTWVDTKTGNAVGFQGATISSLAPAGLPVCYAADATPPAGSGLGFGFGFGDTESGDDRIQKDRRSGPKKP